jgi:muramoyltetrapeptide carboxypeptidase LdcA involved in peptidoglycan recycling
VFGEFVSCEPGADGITTEEVLRDCTASLGIPVLARAPFGHGDVNRPLVMGERAIVGAGRVSLG